MSKQKDYFYKMYALLLVVTLGLGGLYFLPSQVLGWEIKPIDLLADLRHEDANLEEILDVEPRDIVSQEELESRSLSNRTTIDERESEARDTLYDQLSSAEWQRRQQVYDQVVEANGISGEATGALGIVDYSADRTGLRHFFSQIAQRNQLDRPVRIAVLGDSFIEGDIFTEALRERLQAQFGGAGVGWMPMTSETAGFRTSVRHQSRSWSDISALHNGQERHLITGHIFRFSSSAWSSYALPKGREPFDLATIYYQTTSPALVKLTTGDSISTTELPYGEHRLSMQALVLAPTTQLRLDFSSEHKFSCYGVALEKSRGISVDNMSLRGNSGLLLSSLDQEFNEAFSRLREYDLIVLQYGLNVANASQKDYRGYAQKMRQAITRLRRLYPQADVMLLGISDRAQRSSGKLETMPAVLNLHRQQERLAQDLGLPFWSLLRTMQANGGIVRMAQEGKAAKDYTHLNHRGGRELAYKFFEALELQRQYYDEIQN